MKTQQEINTKLVLLDEVLKDLYEQSNLETGNIVHTVLNSEPTDENKSKLDDSVEFCNFINDEIFTVELQIKTLLWVSGTISDEDFTTVSAADRIF